MPSPVFTPQAPSADCRGRGVRACSQICRSGDRYPPPIGWSAKVDWDRGSPWVRWGQPCPCRTPKRRKGRRSAPAVADVTPYGSRQLNSSHNRHRYNPHSSYSHTVRTYPCNNRADARTVKTSSPRIPVGGKTGSPHSKSPGAPRIPVWGKTGSPHSKSPGALRSPVWGKTGARRCKMSARPSLREVR